jgi:hypothetical protein
MLVDDTISCFNKYWIVYGTMYLCRYGFIAIVSTSIFFLVLEGPCYVLMDCPQLLRSYYGMKWWVFFRGMSLNYLAGHNCAGMGGYLDIPERWFSRPQTTQYLYSPHASHLFMLLYQKNLLIFRLQWCRLDSPARHSHRNRTQSAECFVLLPQRMR